jgi:hypothetical protein
MLRIWYVVSVVLYAIALVLVLRRYPETPRLPFVLVACAAAGVWETLFLGQIYIPLVLAAVGAWLLLERGSMTAAGIVIGMLVAIKPNFAVWPTLLFLTGRFRPAVICGITALIISAIPLAFFGPESYRLWLAAATEGKERPYFLTNASILGLAMRADLATAGTIVSLLLLVGSAFWALVRRPSIQVTSTVALLLSVLASPIGWVNYALFLLPLFAWRWSSPVVRIAAAMLMVRSPFIVSQTPDPGFRTLTIGSTYNWALLLLLAMIVVEELRNAGSLHRRKLATGAEPVPA